MLGKGSFNRRIRKQWSSHGKLISRPYFLNIVVLVMVLGLVTVSGGEKGHAIISFYDN